LRPVTRATLSPPTTRAGGTFHEDCLLHPHQVFARPPPPPQWRALAEKLKRSAIVCSTVCRQCGLLSISACHFLPYPSEPVKNTENLATAPVRARARSCGSHDPSRLARRCGEGWDLSAFAALALICAPTPPIRPARIIDLRSQSGWPDIQAKRCAAMICRQRG
jgi:hypothetical protein